MIAREQPQLVSVLHRIGLGPWIPSPAVTVRHTVASEDGEELAEALVAVLAGESSAAIREALLIDGFVRLTIEDYRPVLALRSDAA
jgi:ABC-type phosphate/phosphonate transport system substrate-binding protein